MSLCRLVMIQIHDPMGFLSSQITYVVYDMDKNFPNVSTMASDDDFSWIRKLLDFMIKIRRNLYFYITLMSNNFKWCPTCKYPRKIKFWFDNSKNLYSKRSKKWKICNLLSGRFHRIFVPTTQINSKMGGPLKCNKPKNYDGLKDNKDLWDISHELSFTPFFLVIKGYNKELSARVCNSWHNGKVMVGRISFTVNLEYIVEVAGLQNDGELVERKSVGDYKKFMRRFSGRMKTDASP